MPRSSSSSSSSSSSNNNNSNNIPRYNINSGSSISLVSLTIITFSFPLLALLQSSVVIVEWLCECLDAHRHHQMSFNNPGSPTHEQGGSERLRLT